MIDLQEYEAPGTTRARCADGGCAPLPYVKVTEQGNIWLMLPGDNAGHMLAPGEARRLFRELELVVA